MPVGMKTLKQENRLLTGRTILITGASRRIGKALAIAAAREGANIVVHYGKSRQEAESVAQEIRTHGVDAWILEQDLQDVSGVETLITRANQIKPIDALINNAAIFENFQPLETTTSIWQKHFDINLTAPFILSREFAICRNGKDGRIINILDWRGLKPGKDHFAYTMTKAGLAAMTKALAISFAPQISVNGIALGAILPPSDGGNAEEIIKKVPLRRWATLEEVTDTVLFLLSGPKYITGEIIHVDGGRHLV